MFRSFSILSLIALTFSMISCDDDGPEDPGTTPEELITSVVVRLVADSLGAATSPFQEFRFVDLDGPGGESPVTTADGLAANTLYRFEVSFGNSTTSQLNNEVTDEVREEGDEHQVFYNLSGINGEIRYTDADANGRPIGLSGFFQTNEAGSGTLTLTLRHEPTKDASGVEAGDITNAGGSTDVEVTFPVQVL